MSYDIYIDDDAIISLIDKTMQEDPNIIEAGQAAEIVADLLDIPSDHVMKVVADSGAFEEGDTIRQMEDDRWDELMQTEDPYEMLERVELEGANTVSPAERVETLSHYLNEGNPSKYRAYREFAEDVGVQPVSREFFMEATKARYFQEAKINK